MASTAPCVRRSKQVTGMCTRNQGMDFEISLVHTQGTDIQSGVHWHTGSLPYQSLHQALALGNERDISVSRTIPSVVTRRRPRMAQGSDVDWSTRSIMGPAGQP